MHRAFAHPFLVPHFTNDMNERDSQSMPLPSNRSFGALFVVVFLLVGAWSLWRGGTAYPWWFAASAVVAAVTLLAPASLTPLNRAWMKFGALLGRIVNPIVLGILFYGMIAPAGWIKRRRGWDPMRMTLEPEADSYWIDRRPPGPPPDSLDKQF